MTTFATRYSLFATRYSPLATRHSPIPHGRGFSRAREFQHDLREDQVVPNLISLIASKSCTPPPTRLVV